MCGPTPPAETEGASIWDAERSALEDWYEAHGDGDPRTFRVERMGEHAPRERTDREREQERVLGSYAGL